jgi:hypothetical protein
MKEPARAEGQGPQAAGHRLLRGSAYAPAPPPESPRQADHSHACECRSGKSRLTALHSLLSSGSLVLPCWPCCRRAPSPGKPLGPVARGSTGQRHNQGMRVSRTTSSHPTASALRANVFKPSGCAPGSADDEDESLRFFAGRSRMFPEQSSMDRSGVLRIAPSLNRHFGRICKSTRRCAVPSPGNRDLRKDQLAGLAGHRSTMCVPHACTLNSAACSSCG